MFKEKCKLIQYSISFDTRIAGFHHAKYEKDNCQRVV